MNKHIQIRNVPEGVHRKLKERAAAKGMSLSAYLCQELERLAAFPTFKEIAERLRKLPAPDLPPNTIAETIREEREARDEYLISVLKKT
jgi:plasmid stability protein